MSGRHKWSALKRSVTPERRFRMETKTSELRATLPPTSYAQIRWAAIEYERGEHGYNRFYRNVSDPAFRESLLFQCSECDTTKLLRFLNQWKSRLPDGLARQLSARLPKIVHYLGPLAEAALDDEELAESTFAAAEKAFGGLTSLQYVGPTTASKILGVLNPGLFVMWDGPIQKEYFNWEARNGFAYRIFLEVMRESALSIAADARSQGITDAAAIISAEMRQEPPFTLAKFINDYVWLTVTKKERFSSVVVAQEHHA